MARLATIVSSSSDAIFSKSLAGTVTSWNEAAERLFGYARDEIVGKSFRIVVPPGNQAEEDALVVRISRGERIEPFDTHRTHKSGRLIDVSVTMSPLYAADGRVTGISSIVRDITERKVAAEKLGLLMQEVQHRSKNMLALTQAIARQTAASGTTDFVGRFTERLQGLSTNLELLVGNDWNGVGLVELARAQLAHFRDLIGTRITISGPDIDLNPNAAQHLGMALHELATNAGKYGALSNGSGRLQLTAQLDDGRFRLSWVESGGPAVEVPVQQGFGTTVIKRIVEASVGGKVDLDYAREGFRWALDCPVASVVGTQIGPFALRRSKQPSGGQAPTQPASSNSKGA